MNEEIFDKIQETIKQDAFDYIDDNIEDFANGNLGEVDDLYDTLFVTDEVCGNGYNGCPNRFDDDFITSIIFDSDILKEVFMEFGIETSTLAEKVLGQGNSGRDWIDATVRCYMLSQVIQDATNHLEEALEKYNGENEE
jgi:hypothetical protein